MQTMIYPVQHLPERLVLGVQTENGVREIGFNVKPWLDSYPGMELTIMPTRPGETESYMVADESTKLVGTVLYWYPNSADMALAGEGTVEILGRVDDKRKLSGSCRTLILATTTATTKDAPAAYQPWVDEVLNAAEAAKVGNGVVVVRMQQDMTSSMSKAEIMDAVNAGKAVLLVDALGNVYSRCKINNDQVTFSCLCEVNAADGKSEIGIYSWRCTVGDDGVISWTGGTSAVTPNPHPLTFGGAVSERYDGSSSVSVEIPATLKNPYALKLTGAVEAVYDGSESVVAKIPVAYTKSETDIAIQKAVKNVGLVVKATATSSAGENMEYVYFNKTFDEVVAAIKDGRNVVCHYVSDDGVLVLQAGSYVEDQFVAFSLYAGGSEDAIQMMANGTGIHIWQ